MTRPADKTTSVHRLLARRIHAGSYDATGMLPGERVLSAELGVSRPTIRAALALLDQEGLITRRPARGALLAGNRQASRRHVLGDHLVDLLSASRHDTRRVLDYGRVPAPEAVADALALAPRAPVLRVVRVRSSHGEPVAYTEAFVPPPVADLLSRASLARTSFLSLLRSRGVRIGTAEQTLSAAAAAPEAARALGVADGTPLLLVHRVLRDTAGRPVQFLRAAYRADRYRYRMRLSRVDDATRVWLQGEAVEEDE